jgi:PST family polysaccharide transporter
MSNFISKISSIRRNPEAKTVASNFMWLSALQVAGYVFPLITMPYLARVIGVDGFGKIAFAAAIMVWIQTIVNWGFNLTAIRDAAQNRDNKETLSEIFSNILWSRFFLAGISFFILLGLIATIPAFGEAWDIILISFLMIPGLIIFPEWYFQAIERMKYITILNVVTKLLFTLMVFIFVKEPSDYILQPLFMSLGYLFSGIVSLYIILGRWGIELHRPRYSHIINTIKS